MNSSDLEQLEKDELISLIQKERKERDTERKIIDTERKTWVEQNTNLHRRSRRDSLTGMYNRAQLEAYLNFILQVSRYDPEKFWGAIVILDLDSFKAINDTYGHPEGDLLLQFFTEKLQEYFPEAKQFRSGGDEFTLALQGRTKEEVIAKAEAVKDRLVNGIRYDSIPGKEIIIRVSVGFSEFCLGPDFNPSEAIKLADKRLYDAKPPTSKKYFRRVEDALAEEHF